MDENRGGGSSSSSRTSSMLPASVRPTITLPPRSSVESLFSGGTDASPGPMTLVSNFFSENDPDTYVGSFSQLLAGAISPPGACGGGRMSSYPVSAAGDSNSLNENKSDGRSGGSAGDVDFQFNNGRPEHLVVSQQQSTFTVPPGLSPASLLDSPAFFLPTQGSFRTSHQQVLARVTSQAAQAQTQTHAQPDFPSSSTAPGAWLPHPLPSDLSHPNQGYEPSSVIADKPVEDGYNWRKYGQKQVKGSKYPRSYYKCTHPNCPVKKKVERSFEGQVTEIIYKGQHNHQQPQSKRAKESGNLNGTSNHQGQFESSQAYSLSMKDQESSQATYDHLSGSSGSEEVGNGDTAVDERNEDEPQAKRRNIEVRGSDPLASHRTEPRIIVQTTSEVDLLDDGYRWRKYGQKVVKGNSHPRSYYKCTSQGCNVRKHVERAANDPKAVITTYEGKHNHDVPAAKNSSHNIANTTLSQLRPPNTLVRRPEFLNNQQQQQIGFRNTEEKRKMLEFSSKFTQNATPTNYR